MRHAHACLTLVVGMLLVPAVVAGNDLEDLVSATLDRRPTTVEKAAAPGNHCIIDGSVLSCFTDRGDRDASLVGAGDSGEITLSGTWTVAYGDANFAGGSLAVAGDVSNLHSFGWGDRITSFESATGKKPRWHEHTGYGGLWWSWARGSDVSNVGSVANDKFSSVEADS